MKINLSSYYQEVMATNLLLYFLQPFLKQLWVKIKVSFFFLFNCFVEI